jgi:hypothetical protein
MKYLGLSLSATRLKRIHFQPLEEKVVARLIPWLGKNVTMDEHATHVKLVLPSIVIYYITILDAPIEVLMKNDSIRREIIWAVCGKVMQYQLGENL